MKPARGPKTEFFNNYCNGIPGLANYEMLNEVCEGNFWAIMDSRPLAAELGKSRQVWTSGLTTSNPGIQAIGS